MHHDDTRRRVTRRSLLAGFGGGAALTATGTFRPEIADADEPLPGPTPAELVATGLGHRQAPRWTVDRGPAPRTPGHAQWVAEPGLDGGSLWLGDSTFDVDRTPYQYARELARRNPGVRVVYDKANWGGGGDRYPGATKTPGAGFAAFAPPDVTTGAFSQIFNADTWAAAGGQDVCQPLPGLGGYGLRLPTGARYTPWGANESGSSLTRGAVGVDVRPRSWLGGTQILLGQDDATRPDGRGTLLRLRPDGRVELRINFDGAGTRGVTAVTTVPVTSKVADGTRCAVLFEFDLDKAGRCLLTPYYRTGGHGNPWLPLGDKTSIGGTGAWRGSPAVPWAVGGPSFTGDVFEFIVRKIDRNGPDLLPRLPQQWTPTTPNMKGTLRGGRTYWMTVLPWPQRGLDDFASRTDLTPTAASRVFVRTWNSAPPGPANVVSPLDMVPQLPYLMSVLGSGHNELSTGSVNPQLLRSVLHKLRGRAPGAQPCLLMQNPTLRTDTSAAVTPAGSPVFDQSNTFGLRRSHDWRTAQYAALAPVLGATVLDGRSDMVDYARAGGDPADLLETVGQRVHPTTFGSAVAALGLLNQTTSTDFGTTAVFP